MNDGGALLNWWMSDPDYLAYLYREHRRRSSLKPLLRFLRR